MTHTINETLDGILLVDKPIGCTTYDLIRQFKKTLPGIKIGHCGTLDPLASGLVILLFGSARKHQQGFMGRDKRYSCQIKLGLRTNTGDLEGAVVEGKEVPVLDPLIIEKVLLGFLGEQTQVPPMFSALKHKGQPLYKLARKGQEIPREPRTITIYSLTLLRFAPEEKILEIESHVSSGTYIRVLAEDISMRLGTVGTVAALRRDAIGSFRVQDSVNGGNLRDMPLPILKERLMRVEAHV